MLVPPLALVCDRIVASSPSPKPSSAGPLFQVESLKLLLRQAAPCSEPLSSYFQSAPGVTKDTGCTPIWLHRYSRAPFNGKRQREPFNTGAIRFVDPPIACTLGGWGKRLVLNSSVKLRVR